MNERASDWTRGHYAIYRALLGAFLVVHFACLLPWAAELFSAQGMLGDAQRSPLFGLLPSPFWLDDSPWMATLLLLSGVACGVAIACGRLDRTAAVVCALLLAWLHARNPLIANPSLPLLGWMLLLHAGVPRAAGDDIGWRLPRSLWLAHLAMLALCYSYSGWTKLQSPAWVAGDAVAMVLQNPLARDHLLRTLLLDLPGLLHAITLAILWVELLYAPLYLWPRLRALLWSTMLLAQCGFLLLLDFADLTIPMLLAHLLAFDPRWVQRWAKPQVLTVLYDGACAFCHGCVRIAATEGAQPLRVAALQSDYARQHGFDVAGESVIVIDANGQVHRRAAAVAAVLRHCSGLYVLAGLLLGALPRVLADAGYDVVGRLRLRLAGRSDCPWIGGAAAARVQQLDRDDANPPNMPAAEGANPAATALTAH